jgi:citrate synthase
VTDAEALTKDWWRTAIIEMRPGVIRFGGYPIEDLIGRISFVQMIWLMTRGELPSRAQGELLEAALTAGVDHGPQAPSIAIARMAATCGVGLNNAIASALNVLGDVHGAAGEQTVELFHAIAERQARGENEAAAVDAALDEFTAQSGKFVPMNIDGATAVIYAELGFPAPLARGLFCLSRAVGILAHAWEQTQQGGRNKGPIPRQLIPTYDGPGARRFPEC